MSDNFVEKYNFSRRTLDHRQAADFHNAINKTNNPMMWWRAFSQTLKGNLINQFGIYYVSIAMVINIF